MHLDIEKLADEFFEWDGPRTPVVTLVSAKLFAKHVAGLALKAAREAIKDEHLLEPQDAEDNAYECGLRDADSAVFRVSRQITEGK